MSIATLNLGPLVVEIDGLVKGVMDLASSRLDKEGKEAVFDFIEESEKSVNLLISALSPFYGLSTAEQFEKEFPALYSNFKNMYLTRVGDIRTHCHRVSNHLTRLENNRGWKDRFPWIKNSLLELRKLADKWTDQEMQMAIGIEKIMSEINTELNEISKKLEQNNTTEARIELRDYLLNSEENYLKLKAKLGSLNGLSSIL